MVRAVRLELTLNGGLGPGLYRLGYARKFGAPETTRTSDQGIKSSPLYQLSYRRESVICGLSVLSRWCQRQGVEPATCRLQGGCSAKLSYAGSWLIRRSLWLWLAQPESNRASDPYKEPALPLSYAPPRRRWLFGYAWSPSAASIIYCQGKRFGP
jgi:hypothetical protein